MQNSIFYHSFFSKNMIVVIVSAIAVSHIVAYGNKMTEGLDEKEGLDEEEEDEKEGMEEDEEEGFAEGEKNINNDEKDDEEMH